MNSERVPLQRALLRVVHVRASVVEVIPGWDAEAFTQTSPGLNGSKPCTIVIMSRLTNSASGNPRWRLYFDDATSAVTMTDAAVGYTIEERQWFGREVVLDFVNGQVTGVRHTDEVKD